MNDSARVRWSCPNPDCSWSMVGTMVEAGEPAPRCVCGGEMQKSEVIPVMTYLDFLRGDTRMDEEPPAEKD
jgi:hypothetical protein